jgi:hypothetical protein
MSFSVGVLYSSQDFLRLIRDLPGFDMTVRETFGTFAVASFGAVIELSQACGWIRLDPSGRLSITDIGRRIADARNREVSLRFQIGDILTSQPPRWMPVLKQGRSEARRYLPVDVAQCFREAGLFDSISDDVIALWDGYSKLARRVDKDTKLDIGRIGEKLSFEHECQRTKQAPRWESIESNLSGYDILSITSRDDPNYLRIEVKTAQARPEESVLFLSKNEWQVASLSGDGYTFHLWSLLPEPSLMKVSVAQMSAHVPINNGAGQWERLQVPFRAFI